MCRKQIFDRYGNLSDKIMSIIFHSVRDDESEIQNPVLQGISTDPRQETLNWYFHALSG